MSLLSVGRFFKQNLLQLHATYWGYFPRLDYDTDRNNTRRASDGTYISYITGGGAGANPMPGVFYFALSDVPSNVPQIAENANYGTTHRTMSWVLYDTYLISSDAKGGGASSPLHDYTFWAIFVDPINVMPPTFVRIADMIQFLGKFMIDFFEVSILI